MTTPLIKQSGLLHWFAVMRAVSGREIRKFFKQYGRLGSALVRPLLWLTVFAAGFRNVFGMAIEAPYETYTAYDVYIVPGLIGMVLLFNGMQSSLAMVYDREMGMMRFLLTAPVPRSWLLFCKLCATASLSLLQALAFVAVVLLFGIDLPPFGLNWLHAFVAVVCGALMLGALGLVLSVSIKQLENFAGTMNFVIFPMYFLSTALYPLWKLKESGADWVYQVARYNPFTFAIEWVRFAWYDKSPGIAPWVVLGCTAVFFFIASRGYDPQKGFGANSGRGGPPK